MPSFENVEITTSVTVSLDFEVFCACGAHMCSETSTRNSRNRNAPQAVVNPCQQCIKEATAALEDEIEQLKHELSEVREANEPCAL